MMEKNKEVFVDDIYLDQTAQIVLSDLGSTRVSYKNPFDTQSNFIL